PDPGPPRAPGAPGPRRRQVRRLRAEQAPAQAGTEADVPSRREGRPRASGERRATRARRAAAARAGEVPEASRMSYELLIFDWDGTLMDSTGVIASSLQAACGALGIAVPRERDARYVIGLGLADSFDHVAPGLDEAGRLRLSERYRRHFLARESQATPYAGVPEMLATLHGRGRRLAVATGKA